MTGGGAKVQIPLGTEATRGQTIDLDAESQHEWTAEIQLPTNTQGTYRGHHTNHVWEFQAALDVKGNDPDSGWQELSVN